MSARGLLARLREAPEAGALDDLLQTYEGILAEPSGHDELIRERILGVEGLRSVAKMIIILWYTGELLSSKPSPMTEEQHFQALVWNTAHAHPPWGSPAGISATGRIRPTTETCHVERSNHLRRCRDRVGSLRSSDRLEAGGERRAGPSSGGGRKRTRRRRTRSASAGRILRAGSAEKSRGAVSRA